MAEYEAGLGSLETSGWDGLAAAVIFQAYRDLKKWLVSLVWMRIEINKLEIKAGELSLKYLEKFDKGIEKEVNKISQQIEAKEKNYTATKNAACETAAFFKSASYDILCSLDSDAILEQVWKEVVEENERKRRKKKGVSKSEVLEQNEKVYGILKLGLRGGGIRPADRQIDIPDRPSGLYEISEHLSVYVEPGNEDSERVG